MSDQTQSNEERPLRRSYHDRIIAGVAGGIAEYFDLDVAVVRLAFVAFTLLGGAGLPLYAAAWLFIPEEGAEESMASLLLHHRTA
ncbi:MAG TPA: PspC domain-containing protein [Acidimicrobiales bacterium]|nr:PspC domain-containing protein [Acidimicrobiales bacterium]